MLRFLSHFVLLVVVINAHAQGINFSHQYKFNSLVQLQYRVVYNQNTTDVLLQIQSPDSLTLYEGRLNFKSSYSQNQPDSSASVFLQNAQFNSDKKAWFLDLSFPKIDRKRLLIIQFVHKKSGLTYNFDIPLFYTSDIHQSSTIIYDTTLQTPVISPILNTNQAYKTDQTEVVSYYANQFEAALPAMSLSTPKSNSALSKTNSFIIQPNQSFSLKNEGMYFFENDTSNLHGATFCVRDAPFPSYQDIEDLIGPLRYICTNAEFEKLKADPGKENFEKVWLTIAGSNENAKTIIKKYYRRVAEANQLFTTYKEGWKTDQGMIYIVFGPPKEVYKTDKKEEWIYVGTAQQSKLKFTFAKMDNVFSPNHYSLHRKKEYKTPWMNRVYLWRKGKIDN